MTTTAATPILQWQAATVDLFEQIAERVAEVQQQDVGYVLSYLAQAHSVGMRPARALASLGVLTSDNYLTVLPAEPEAEEEAPDEADDDHDDVQVDPLSPEPLAEPDQLRFEDVDLALSEDSSMDMMQRLKMLPYRIKADCVMVASAQPQQSIPELDVREIKAHLKPSFPDKKVEFVYVLPVNLTTCFEQITLARDSVSDSDVEAEVDQRAALDNYETLTKPTASIVGNQSGPALQRLLLQAIERGASDIHIFGDRDQHGNPCYKARLRVDGSLSHVRATIGDGDQIFTREIGQAIVGRIANAGKLSDTPNIPRSGRFEIEMPSVGSRHDLRVEITPMRNEGFYAVIRVLGGEIVGTGSLSEIYPPEESGIAAGLTEVLDDMRSGGLFIISGATGSGKSTLLAAMMKKLNVSDKNLISIENPIERRIPGVRQIQVEPKNEKMGFVSAIESAMRLDPDRIMIGELRSRETVEVAIQAAETGHMVLSTLHVTSAASTPSRFRNLGIRPADLSFVLKGVLAQSLVKTLCPRCVRVGAPADACTMCRGTGTSGRAAVGELMPVTEEIAKMIAEERSPTEIERAAGYASKAVNAGSLIAVGKTSAQAVADELGSKAAATAERAARDFRDRNSP